MDSLTSLRQGYEIFRARELNFYKDVVSRRTIMQVADEACARLEERDELLLHDLTLASAVDEIIAERLRLPAFRVWVRAQRLRTGARRRPASHSLQLTLPLMSDATSGAVLLLQARADDAWESIAQLGSRVLVVEPELADRERVLERATRNGWESIVRVAPSYEAIDSSDRFSSVCYTPAACADYADWEAEAMIESLKDRTLQGGIHVVEGLLQERSAAPRAVLRRGYASWTRRVQRGSREWTLIAHDTRTGPIRHNAAR